MLNISLSIEEYDYFLPEDRIAQFPVKNRELSKLLVAIQKPYQIALFKDIVDYLPDNAVLIYNDTKVIPARLIFQKPTGARIEIFLIKPRQPGDYQENFHTTSSVVWEVMIGNAARWKEGRLQLRWVEKDEEQSLEVSKLESNLVRFTWKPPTLTFGEILEKVAHVPLPPYIKREDNPDDRNAYQTVYAYQPGSVAAPTAGLHFTEEILEQLTIQKNILKIPITLHVGLGTFKPVKSAIAEHEMHAEPVIFTKESVMALAKHADKPWIVVGTTSLRALESLYYYLLYLLKGKKIDVVPQWIAWETSDKDIIPRTELFKTIMKENIFQNIFFETQLFILPGKPVLMGDYLITNFHQPRSTLLLLVDAFASQSWKGVYSFALQQELRFLSYGDACLFKNKNKRF